MKHVVDNCVSVIIPALNEADTISGILADLCIQQTHLGEIIVVDGGSHDGTEKIVKEFPLVTFVKSPKANVAFQRNLGAKHAKGPWLLFVDADSRIDQGVICHMIREMIERNLSVGCPLYEPITKRRSLQIIYQFFNAFFVVFETIAPSGGGMGMVVKKRLFDQVKGFDETLTYEDIAFIRRASRVGTFGILSEKIGISVRRFEQQGILHVFGVYLLLSIFFLTGQFKLANYIKYSYHYRK